MIISGQGAPPLSHRAQLAEKILLAILGNTTNNVKKLIVSLPGAKTEIAECCLEMADAMIACQNTEKEKEKEE